MVGPGVSNALAIKTDGTLWAWGFGDSFGVLGLGDINVSRTSPVQVGALTNWATVAIGVTAAAAVKTDGTLWAWGRGNYGQLGLGNTTDYSSPKQVGALTNWSKVTINEVPGMFAIKTDGTLWTWGNSTYGQLGHGNTTNYSSPKQVGALTNWATLAAGSAQRFMLAVKTDGTLWAWGRGGHSGELGLGNLTNYSSPKQVGALTNWSVPGGLRYGSLAIKTDGTLWSWGRNNAGQGGLGNTTYYSSPKQVGTSTTWTAVAAGADHTIAIQT